MKRNINYNSDSAWVEKIEIDLADKGTLQKYITTQSVAPFSKVTVTAMTNGAVGTSGNITIEQSPFASGKPSNSLHNPFHVSLGADVNNFGHGTFEQEFVTLDLSAVTLGSVGSLTLIVHCKR